MGITFRMLLFVSMWSTRRAWHNYGGSRDLDKQGDVYVSNHPQRICHQLMLASPSTRSGKISFSRCTLTSQTSFVFRNPLAPLPIRKRLAYAWVLVTLLRGHVVHAMRRRFNFLAISIKSRCPAPFQATTTSNSTMQNDGNSQDGATPASDTVLEPDLAAPGNSEQVSTSGTFLLVFFQSSKLILVVQFPHAFFRSSEYYL